MFQDSVYGPVLTILHDVGNLSCIHKRPVLSTSRKCPAPSNVRVVCIWWNANICVGEKGSLYVSSGSSGTSDLFWIHREGTKPQKVGYVGLSITTTYEGWDISWVISIHPNQLSLLWLSSQQHVLLASFARDFNFLGPFCIKLYTFRTLFTKFILRKMADSSSPLERAHYQPPWADVSIIGIAGSSGSGKSTLSHAIVSALNLPWVVILSMVCWRCLFNTCTAADFGIGFFLQTIGCWSF